MSQQASQKEADRINHYIDKGISPKAIEDKMVKAGYEWEWARVAIREVIDCRGWRLYAAI